MKIIRYEYTNEKANSYIDLVQRYVDLKIYSENIERQNRDLTEKVNELQKEIDLISRTEVVLRASINEFILSKKQSVKFVTDVSEAKEFLHKIFDLTEFAGIKITTDVINSKLEVTLEKIASI